jgi:hypothetical protein
MKFIKISLISVEAFLFLISEPAEFPVGAAEHAVFGYVRLGYLRRR